MTVSWRGERGAGSVLAVGVVAATVAAVLLMTPVAVALLTKQRVTAASEAAALAAADVVAGIAPGSPCAVATTVAQTADVGLTACVIEGPVVTVATSRSVLGFVIRVAATAGPVGFR